MLNLRFRFTLFMTMVMILAFAAVVLAATANPRPTSPGYTPVVLPIMGAYSSTTLTGVVKWKAPAQYDVVHASATARTSSGTNPTLTVNVKSGATSMFSAPISVTAGSITDAVLGTNHKLSDEGTVSVDLAVGGTSNPKFSDITLFLLLKRL